MINEQFTYYTLPNGIRCVLRQVHSAVAYCALTVGTGSRDELKDEFGLAHLLEHAFFKGTAHRRAYHINCRLENLGGELNAYTTKEETVVHATTLGGDFAKAADLLSDIVFCSTFPQKEIEREKVVIVDEINSYKDSPSDRIFDDFEDMIFEHTSLGHNILGGKSSLMSFGPQELHRFVDRTYNTDQIVFSVIGGITPRRFKTVCDRYFGAVRPSVRTFSRDRAACAPRFEKHVNRHCHQTYCLLGGSAYNLNDERRVALSLLSNLLGGPSANSLLNLAVRERNGLSYNIEAGYTPFSDTGLATIFFSSDAEKTDECLELVECELQKLRQDRLSDRALQIAKKQYLGQITVSMENDENYMLGAARSYMIYDRIDTMETICRKIRSITRTELVEVAREVFGRDNLSQLIYR